MNGRWCFYFTNKAGEHPHPRETLLAVTLVLHRHQDTLPPTRLSLWRGRGADAAWRGGPQDAGDQSGPAASNCGFSTYLQTPPRLIGSLMPPHPFGLGRHRVHAGTGPQSPAPTRQRQQADAAPVQVFGVLKEVKCFVCSFRRPMTPIARCRLLLRVQRVVKCF